MNIPRKPIETGNFIADAIDAAEEIRDPLDELVEKCATDVSAPFESDNVALLADLKARNPGQFERIRMRLREKKVRMGELEKLISRHNRTEETSPSGSPLEFDVIEMWPDPVNGELLFNEIVALIRRHMVLPPLAAEAIAMWIIFSHTHDIWSISPRLAFVSPEKRCGKTTALSIIQQLVPKPLPASNITAAALFRSISLCSPTLIIDEADTFLRGNDELRGILNSGHNRSQARVIRTTGEDHTPATFCTWAPVSIAMIGNLPDTLNDRSIVINLKRKMPRDKVERFRLDRVAHFEKLRRMICRWTADNTHKFSSWDGSVPEALHDRAADNWRPLLAIADAIGGKCSSLAREAAATLTGIDDEGSVGVLLLRDIRSIFGATNESCLPTTVILDRLWEMESRPWPEYRNEKPITASQLAKLLKPFGIKPASKRFGNDENAKGYSKEGFDDAISRYLPLGTVTPSQVNEINELQRNQVVTPITLVTVKTEKKPNENNGRDGVTAKLGDKRDEALTSMQVGQQASYHRSGRKRMQF